MVGSSPPRQLPKMASTETPHPGASDMSLRPLLKTLALALTTCMLPAASAMAADDGYCASNGGVLTTVYPYANTNADASQWIRYGGSTKVCTFTDGDGASINVWAGTLTSRKPTMAALAYYAKVPWNGQGHGNPAWLYCIQLGGTEQIGVVGSGSGWATAPGADQRYMCHFADGSAIDDWGLLYHANDIIRGKDLDGILRFANPY